MSQEDHTNYDDKEASEMMSSMTIHGDEKNTVLIWFNPDRDSAEQAEVLSQNLRVIGDEALFPTDVESCIDNIKRKNMKKIILVVSAENIRRLPSDIIDRPQLDSIFIFPKNRERYNDLSGNYPKIVEIFENPNDLISSIKENITQKKKFPFNNQQQRGTRIVSEQSAQILWFQLLKYVIQNSPNDDKAKEEMVTACRLHYQDNSSMLERIEKFDQTYNNERCFEWYTKDTFIYKLINAALRSEDLEKLYIYRYYIADLSKQLADEYQTFKERNIEKKISLFRGTTITKDEIEKHNTNIGKLFAVNSYWSTSRDRQIAERFTPGILDDPNTTAALYEIECDLEDQNDSAIFADICHASVFPEEQEILFDAGSVFQIETVDEGKEDRRCVIKIKTTKESQEIVKTYIDELRVEMEHESPRIMLGVLLKRIGKYERSLKYFEELLEKPGEENIAHIHNRIGIALKLQGQYDRALEHFDKAYDLISKSDVLEKVYLAFIHHNQGEIYASKREFSQALDYYNKAVRIIKQEIAGPNRYLADYYSHIGRIYLREKIYKRAIFYQTEALTMRSLCLPPNHVLHAFSQIEFAKIFSSRGKYKKALEYNLKALKLRETFLLPDHLNIALSLYFVGKMYFKMLHKKKALSYYNKALEMKRKCLPDSQPYITPSILQDIALLHGYNCDKALRCLLEALDIQIKAKSINCSSLPSLLNNIASTYKSMNRKEDLLKFYERALEIRETYLYQDKSGLARLLDDMGYAHGSMGNLEASLEFYQKGLQSRKKNLRNNHLSFSYSYNNLASVYELLGDLPSARQSYNQALQIYQYHYHPRYHLCKKTRQNIRRTDQRLQWKKT